MASGVRKGPWTEKEDETLRSYIRKYGQGHWEALAHRSGLNRTGQSCRLRWLNYLRPGVRHGNITLQEQLIILQLHFRWGNRWAKIAECLPGRSDNEVKNYWRTRVQKQAKKLQCDVKEIMHQVWIPQLAELIQAQIKSSSSTHDLNVMRIRSVSDPVSHQSSDACDRSNENVSGDTLAAWIGAGSDGDHADQTYLGRYVPDEDYVLWMKQGVEVDEEQELATAWDDPGSCNLGNLLNDEDMVFLSQQLLDDHQA